MRIILIFVFCVLINSTFCQTKQNYSWVTGSGNSFIITKNVGQFQFSSYYDTSFISMYRMGGGSSNVCDSNGNIKLVSNGTNIIGSNKNIIDGGDSIGGRAYIDHYNGTSPYSQSSLFLPMDSNKYYYINCSATDSMLNNVWFVTGSTKAPFNLLNYSIVDMNANSGLGKVIQKEIPLLSTGFDLSKVQMMACKHANGKDWWLLKQLEDTNIVCKFLLKQNSFEGPFWQGFTEPKFSRNDQNGQSVFSQDGLKYATTSRGASKIFVSDFDRCTGMLSNPKIYNLPTLDLHGMGNPGDMDIFCEGLAFSPSSKFLYISMYANIQQLDLLNPDSATAWHIVAGLDTTLFAFQSYSNMYLGPDNKLYIGNWNGLSKQMSIIENPDVKGAGCNFCPRCLRMPKQGVTNPPCMPNYDLGAINCWPLDTGVIKEGGILLYPNPTNDNLILESDKFKENENEILIFDLLGQIVFKNTVYSTSNKIRIDIHSLSIGVYLIRVGGYLKKFVKE